MSTVRFGTPAGRWVVLAAVLGSAVAMLDATVVNVALPTIGADMNVGFAGLQWVVTSYLITLAAFILLGGGLGDLYGRKKIFIFGTAWFAVASVLCAIAPNAGVLIAARALQGVGGALLTPASLAMIQASFHPDDRGRAIGAWSGLGGVAAALGPFLGGGLVEVSWRLIFLLNVPLAVVVIVVAIRHVPETTDPSRAGWHPDIVGGLFGALGLAGLTYALIRLPDHGVGATSVRWALLATAIGFAGFIVTEVRERHPMLPLDIFTSREFTGANIATFAIYAALGGFFFLFAITLQRALQYSPLEAGAAGLPVTIVMLALSPFAGRIRQHIGARIPMTAGPLVMAVGLVLVAQLEPGDSYATAIAPGILLFAFGLVATVAPLTTTVLAAADPEHAGVASGVNNAVARTAGLVAVAVLPAAAGIGGDAVLPADVLTNGFRTAAYISAAAVAIGGIVSLLTVRPMQQPTCEEDTHVHCSLTGPPQR